MSSASMSWARSSVVTRAMSETSWIPAMTRCRVHGVGERVRRDPVGHPSAVQAAPAGPGRAVVVRAIALPGPVRPHGVHVPEGAGRPPRAARPRPRRRGPGSPPARSARPNPPRREGPSGPRARAPGASPDRRPRDGERLGRERHVGVDRGGDDGDLGLVLALTASSSSARERWWIARSSSGGSATSTTPTRRAVPAASSRARARRCTAPKPRVPISAIRAGSEGAAGLVGPVGLVVIGRPPSHRCARGPDPGTPRRRSAARWRGTRCRRCPR